MTDERRAPIRLEHDGDVAVVILDDPPLNLFTSATFEALARPATRSPLRTPGRWSSAPRARSSRAASTSAGLRRRRRGAEEGARLAADGIRELQAFESLEIPTLALVHGLCLTAGLEASLGCDMIWAAEGAAVRARRAGRRPDPVRRRRPADGRARRPRAGPRVRHDRRALRRRADARVGRRQPGPRRPTSCSRRA